MLELMDPPSYFFTWFTLTAVVVVMKMMTKYGSRLGLSSETTEILCVPFPLIFYTLCLSYLFFKFLRVTVQEVTSSKKAFNMVLHSTFLALLLQDGGAGHLGQ